MSAPALGAGSERRNERLLFGLPLVALYAMSVVAYLAVGETGLLRTTIINVILLLAAGTAAVSCFVRAKRDPERLPWVLFGVAALAAALSHVIWSVGLAADAGTWLLTLSYIAFTAGAAVFLQVRDRASLSEFALDAMLIVGAAGVAVTRWAPAAQAVISEPSDFTAVLAAMIVVSSVAAISSLFFALVPLAQATSAVLFALTGAAASFALATLPLALRGVECCRDGNPLGLVTVLGWVFLTYGSLANDRKTHPFNWPTGWRSRHLIAPGVAVLMSVILVDAALRPPIYLPTTYALGLLGLLLSARLLQLLVRASQQTRDRQQLEQAHALIEVSNALAAETDLNATLAEVTVIASRLMHARAAALELLTDDGNTLEIKAAAGLPYSAVGMRFPVANSFTGWVVQNGRARQTRDASQDPIISAESRALLGHAPLAAVPLRFRGQPLGTLSCISDEPFSEEDMQLLGALADQASIAIENARLFQQVHGLSVTDPLTRLANRRQLERDLHREFAAARRGRQLVAVMFDLNGFKAYNDKYGHLAGDQALCAFADTLAHETRAMNLAARYGGDEFVVLLADSDRFGARIFVQRVRQGFDKQATPLGRDVLSVEAGIAEYTSDMNAPDDLLEAADRALYEAKGSRSKR